MVSHRQARKCVPTQFSLRPDVAKSASGRIFIPLVAQFERLKKEQKKHLAENMFSQARCFYHFLSGLITGEPGTSR